MRVALRLVPCLVLVAVTLSTRAALAQAPTQIKGRMMVLVDSSSSMTEHFTSNTECGGDGDASSLYTDPYVTSQNYYPGVDGYNSRLYAAKSALTNLLNSSGDLDFGLMRYHPSVAACNAATNNANNFYCCVPSNTQGTGLGACLCVTNYTNYTQRCGKGGAVTWFGDCGPKAGGTTAIDGGQIVVFPSPTSAPKVLSWVDNVEDFRNDGAGNPRNPELRASGVTPLAGAARTALNSWYKPIADDFHGNPSCNPTTDANCDPQVDCRPYVFVLMTDGADTCEGCTSSLGCTTAAQAQIDNPPLAVKALHDYNPANPVLTYVIGLAIVKNDPAVGVLNNMAIDGGTGYARFANSQAEIEAALADISASTVKFEACNGLDDNCNTFVDEGLGVYQECTAGTQCNSGTCNLGRCTCTSNANCKSGFVCGNGLCVPGCSVGVGACLRNGVTKCSSPTATACCANDGKAACTALQAGTPTTEVCNGIDDDCNGIIDDGGVCQKCNPQPEVCNGMDDDCNGKIDDNLTDTGKACGVAIGLCTTGTTACVADAGKTFPDASDHLVCQGAVMPAAPACNGCDNDCDGVIDQPTVSCYDGPVGTANKGICVPGLKKCALVTCNPTQAPQYSSCVGEVLPKSEVCNGVDDDCNGKVDDVSGANMACCPSGKCGVGACVAGTMQCSGGVLACVGAVGPSVEICDGLDNDCNGKVDDVPGIGNACQPQGGCGAGTLQCDVASKSLVCKSNGGTKAPEVCNGLDDDCDGIVDNPDEVMKNDPRIGVACGNTANLPLPCMAGKTVCKNGGVVCQGAVGPMPEVCNGLDDNCDGMVDVGAMCPPTYDCYMGGCYQKCKPANEFDTGCPGGYTCDTNKYCVPDGCAGGCTACQACQGGQCTDLCMVGGMPKACPATYKCDCGNCVDDSCVSKGCPTGQICDVAARMCKTDPCSGVHCSANQFCDPTSGACVGSCAGVTCPAGQTCQMGSCATDKCAGKQCPEGQACDASTGTCIANPCSTVTCDTQGFVCVKGMCIQDPCGVTQCPGDATCKTNPLDGTVSCVSKPKTPQDLVVGGGGGGFGCSVGAPGGAGGRAGGGSSLLGLALLVGAGLLRRRRSARGGRGQ